jgi:hypothetical protein
MSTHTLCAKILPWRGVGRQCSNRAVRHSEFCGTHDPAAIARREKDKDDPLAAARDRAEEAIGSFSL